MNTVCERLYTLWLRKDICNCGKSVYYVTLVTVVWIESPPSWTALWIGVWHRYNVAHLPIWYSVHRPVGKESWVMLNNICRTQLFQSCCLPCTGRLRRLPKSQWTSLCRSQPILVTAKKENLGKVASKVMWRDMEVFLMDEAGPHHFSKYTKPQWEVKTCPGAQPQVPTRPWVNE